MSDATPVAPPTATPTATAMPNYAPPAGGPSKAAPGAGANAESIGPLEISFVRALFFLAVLSGLSLFFAEQMWGTANPVWPFLTTAFAILAYRRLRAGKKAILGRMLGNLISLVAIGKLLLDLTALGALMTAVGKLLTLLLWVKLLQEKKNRDYVQVLLLSFGQMLVAAVLTQEMWFGAASLVFLLVTTWTLLLFHFKREGDGDYHPAKQRVVDWKSFRTSELISRAFLGLMLASLVLTGIGTAVVFVSIPRFTSGWLNAILPTPPRQETGLSDRVRLGGSGTISKNYREALYAEFDTKPDWPLLYRAAVQDNYDGRTSTWLPAEPLVIEVPTRKLESLDVTNLPDAVRCEITDKQQPRMLLQLATPGPLYTPQPEAMQRVQNGVRFGSISPQYMEHDQFPPYPRWVDMPYRWPILAEIIQPVKEEMQFVPGVRVLQMRRGQSETIRYRVIVRKPPSGPAYEAAQLREIPTIEVRNGVVSQRRSYRPFPLPDESRQRLRQWVREQVPEIRRGEGWPVARVNRLVKVLSSQPFFYTLEKEPAPPGTDPILHFLFERKGGHCEYFASALALILWAENRSVRVVTGFAGGQNWLPSEDGKKAVDLVLNAHAHAWVEAEVEGFGWVPFNPSPASGAQPQPLSDWQLWFAAMQYRWQKHVVRFDLAQQIDIVNWIREAFEDFKAWISGVGANLLGAVNIDAGQLPTWLPLALGILIVGGPLILLRILLRRWWRNRKPKLKPHTANFAPLIELLAIAERAGVRRGPAVTAQEFLHAPALADHLAPADRERFLRGYHAARFGGQAPGSDELAALNAIVARIKQALRAAKSVKPAPEKPAPPVPAAPPPATP